MNFGIVFTQIPFLSTILLSVTTFIRLTQETKMEEFFRWLYLGGILDVVYNHYNLIAPFLVIGFMLKWVRDWRILAGIGALIFVFITYAL
jgi:hypothetical protein